MAQPLAGRSRIQAVASHGPCLCTIHLMEAQDLDHILTILGRILTSLVKVGHYVGRRLSVYYSALTSLVSEMPRD